MPTEPVSSSTRVSKGGSRGADEPLPKRRKPGGGLSSCLDCRRRHVRCEFDHRSRSTCISCRRRGSKCLPYTGEHPEDEADSQYIEVGKKIDHVESLLHQLIRQRNIANQSLEPRLGSGAAALPSNASIYRPIRPRLPSETSRGLFSEPGNTESSQSDSRYSLLARDPAQDSALSRLVNAFFPPQEVVALIMQHGKFYSLPLQIFSKAFKKFAESPSAQDLLSLAKPPPLTAHPICQAQRLIQLAICLQQTEQTSDIVTKLRLGESIQEASVRLFDAASRFVTSQHSLVRSLEGIETLMLEGLYHINLGSWRRAWLSFRRALDSGRVMGLHAPHTEAKVMQSSYSAELLWFRLNYFDRFISLFLRLPSYLDNAAWEVGHLGAPEGLYGELERFHGLIMGSIITRNERMWQAAQNGTIDYDHTMETRNIDNELKRVARTFPVRWWTIPTLGSEAAVEKTVRLHLQIHQYNLLLLLHLPYILEQHCPRGPAESVGIQRYACPHRYNKLSAVSASRELLSRFIVYHTFALFPKNCPGTSVKGIIASAALLLAHIDSYGRECDIVLEHQRPHDLSMIDYAIETLAAISRHHCDNLSTSARDTLTKLVALENEAAEGVEYVVMRHAQGAVGDLTCSFTETERGMELSLPYLGDVVIMRGNQMELSGVDGVLYDLF